jgi:hypothetical protein
MTPCDHCRTSGKSGPYPPAVPTQSLRKADVPVSQRWVISPFRDVIKEAESNHYLGQRPSRHDAAARLDLPDHWQGVAVTAVFDPLQDQQGAPLAAGYGLVAYPLSAAADRAAGQTVDRPQREFLE